jgi:hypothetical protein
MRPRRMRLLVIFSVAALICFAQGSTNAGVTGQGTAYGIKLGAGPFSILAPSGWEVHHLQGALATEEQSEFSS